jgi:hypothetical protein
MSAPTPTDAGADDETDRCPTCGVALPDPRHIIDQANRTLAEQASGAAS